MSYPATYTTIGPQAPGSENRDAHTKPKKESSLNSLNAAFISLGVLGVAALLCSCFYLSSIIPLIIAFAALATGGITGFIFGIPRTVQKATIAEGQTEIVDNTNLEQISDWLTKILVGVGLTQMDEITSSFNYLAREAGKALPSPSDTITITKAAPPEVLSVLLTPPADNTVFAGALLLFFALDGFLICYLWTRLVLTQIQKNGLTKEVEKIKYKDELDTAATTAAYRQLNHSTDTPDIPSSELYAIFKKASVKAISEVFIMTVKYRQDNWQQNKACVPKTIPIFDALIQLGTAERAEYYAQLGYALKDSATPDYTRAIDSFDKAIAEFEKKGITQGLSTIHFNRALALIELDRKNPPERSTDTVSARINADIQAASADTNVRDAMAQTTIPEWQQLNAPL